MGNKKSLDCHEKRIQDADTISLIIIVIFGIRCANLVETNLYRLVVTHDARCRGRKFWSRNINGSNVRFFWSSKGTFRLKLSSSPWISLMNVLKDTPLEPV